jgi:hypothetical protein
MHVVGSRRFSVANDFSGDPYCVALFKFDGNPNDSKGSNNLTAVNSPTYDSGDKKEGTHSIVFSKASVQYCSIDDVNLDVGFPGKSGTPEQSLSICGWFKLEAVDVYQGLVCKYVTSSPKRSYGVAIGADGKARFMLGYNNGANASAIIFDTPFEAGKWYHIKATYNATNNQMRLRIWDDNAGALLDAVKEGTAAGDMSPTDAPLQVGAYNDGTNTMDGKTDEVVIFRDVLTDDEQDQIIAGTYVMPAVEFVPRKDAYDGYRCYVQQHIKNKMSGASPWKLPDGTKW